MKNTLVLIAAIAAGVALGWLGAVPLAVLSWGNALIWAAACVGFGLVDGTMRGKAVRLGCLGFTIGFAFMCFGYAGEAALVTRFAPFALIGLVCAVLAIAVGATVHQIRQRVRAR